MHESVYCKFNFKFYCKHFVRIESLGLSFIVKILLGIYVGMHQFIVSERNKL